jgi:branched-chain amino acid transport system permease protein
VPPPGVIAVGLVIGALGAFNSLGMILLWRTTRLVNLAQPSLGLVGGVLTGLLVTSAGWSFWWALPVGLMVGALLGLATDRVVLRRLQDAPRAVLLVVTVGLAAIFSAIQAGIPFVFVGRPLPTYSIDLGVNIFLPGGVIQGAHVAALTALVLCGVGSYLFLYRTRLGLSALALGQDQERARALGIPAGTVRGSVWAIAGILGTVSGIFVIPIMGFRLGGALDATVLMLALAPAVFAGFRSLGGAVAAALALGVVFQTVVWFVPRAGLSQLVLAGAVLAAVAVQRRRLGREDAALRASSWEAAATPRPLPWEVRRMLGVRVGSLLVSIVLVAAAGFAPFLLSPSNEIAYGNAAAISLATLAVVVAWMFAGEVALGHWGFAGLGAALAAILPGPWLYRVVVAAILMGVAGAILGVVSRRRSSLSFAVLGLAAATAGPVAILAVNERSIPANPEVAASAAGVIAVAAAIGVVWLRNSVAGARLVAARDDPQRGPWLGAEPVPARMLSLALSIGLAGLAGGLYAATSPIGLIAGSSGIIGAFDFTRSLDILAMAVVGGLGSPAGAIAGAALIQAGRLILPNAAVLLVSGIGITLVVIFQPAGISRVISWIRVTLGRALAGSRTSRESVGPREEEPQEVSV